MGSWERDLREDEEEDFLDEDIIWWVGGVKECGWLDWGVGEGGGKVGG